ncbi:MAG: hypothetical protein J6A88_00735 [Oscillospiraceae bacterium]|nr:hypothetical protein [Oscillospiraceae bacterium]
MSKSDPALSRKQKRKTALWVLTIFIVTIIVSSVISLISEEVMAGSGMLSAFLILFAIILLGILFDVVGVAVTSADEAPFHAMAARKVPGAKEAIHLLRKADKVSSICNDVIGDICGVVSGSAAATIAVQLLQTFTFSWERLSSLMMSAMVAGVTVGGKALGKGFAVNSSTTIVHTVGKVIWWLSNLPQLFRRKKK